MKDKYIEIRGKKYKVLFGGNDVPELIRMFTAFMDWEKPAYLDKDGRLLRADGKDISVVIKRYRGKHWVLVKAFYEERPIQKSNIMKKSTKKSACSASKRRSGGNTIKFASDILKQQKEDYKKIFRSEVKKASSPKEGAKKAGRIYRERYGATAEARWKKAINRAK